MYPKLYCNELNYQGIKEQ